MLSIAALRSINRKTWSGHNHTEFCPHGSGEDVELFIRRAIECGFKTYSITEHFPLPEPFYQPTSGSRHAVATAAMLATELPQYFAKLNYLKAKYRQQIRILVGFEVDYIAEYADWIAEQLAVYHQQIDDAILSVHFLPTPSGLRAVDDTAADFRNGVLPAYGSPLGVANAYLTTVQQAVNWQVPHKPHRYGHLMLYRKWRNTFPSQTIWGNQTTQKKFKQILTTIQTNGDLLDCNMAGLFRPTETESSPNATWIQIAHQHQIPLVFGADAHSVSAVAEGYNTYLENQDYL